MAKENKQALNFVHTKFLFIALCLLFISSLTALVFFEGSIDHTSLILNVEDYHDSHFHGIAEQLLHRIKVQPINLIFLTIFLCAVIHTFAAFSFQRLVKKKYQFPDHTSAIGIAPRPVKNGDFFTEMLFFFGEVEVIFGLWCIPLMIAISYTYSWKTTLKYVNSLNYTEALFLMVTLALCSTRPILQLAEKWLGKIAKLGGGTPSSWWITLLTVGPFLGSIFKESVAMTLLALLLGRYFYKYHPSVRLAYSTLALLFLYVSIAGMLTTFASSSVYVVKGAWKWNTPFMLQTFGWKVFVSIIVCNILYFFIFHTDFSKVDKNAMQATAQENSEATIPAWVTAVHVGVLIWIILNSENTIIALGSFVLFLGFYLATAPYQYFMELLRPILVGFFLASLMIVSGLQIWWIEPLITNFGHAGAYIGSLFISAFIHNTSSNILYTHIPNLSDAMKYFLFCGTMVGGALTIMANGPNIIGYSILSPHFDHALSLKRLFFMALWPTLLISLIFVFF